MKFIIKLVLHAAAAVLPALTLAPLVIGQENRPNPSPSRGVWIDSGRLERESRERAAEESEREFALRMVDELRKPKPVERRQPRLTFAQIREDYVRIQVVNNNLAQAASQGGALNLKFIIESASEIKKRAARLKLNLALPEPEQEPKRTTVSVVAEPAQLKSSLSTLDELIIRFVRNPVFRSVNVVNAQESAKARRDLEAIIALSGQIKKSSEKLNEAAQQH